MKFFLLQKIVEFISFLNFSINFHDFIVKFLSAFLFLDHALSFELQVSIFISEQFFTRDRFLALVNVVAKY